MLFVELALIRWAGSNVIFLAYFSNFVLLGSFLGIGIGFLRARSRVDLFRYAPVALTFLIAFVVAFRVEIDKSGEDLIFVGLSQPTGLPMWVVLPVIFVAVAGVMAMIAEGVGRTFVEFEPLEAYRYDIAGSILGIVAFSLLSFTWAPPVAWGAVVAVLFIVLLRPRVRILQLVALAGLLIILGRESFVDVWSWSPYYKVATIPRPDIPGASEVFVNGVPFQTFMSVEDRRKDPAGYFLPYERLGTDELDDVLIVGAGTGTDLAVALSRVPNTSMRSRSIHGSCRSASSCTRTGRTPIRASLPSWMTQGVPRANG